MPTLLTLSLPPEALEQWMDGYRRRDPVLMGILKELKVSEITMPDEEASGWENEGGR